MKDSAGNSLRKADKINFRNSVQKIRESVGGTDEVDIFRFKARSSTIDITARKLNSGETVELYQVNKNLGRTLRRIGKTDFSSIRPRRLNRFLTSVDLSVSSRGRRDTYSADVERDTYFLVVSSDAARSSNYRLRFSAKTDNGTGQNPTPPTQPPSVPASINQIIAGLTETSLYTQNGAGTAVPDDQNQLELTQVPFTSSEATEIANTLAASSPLPASFFTGLLNGQNLIAASDAVETPVVSGVQLDSRVNGGNTGYVGYTNYALDNDSINISTLSADLTPVNASGPTVLNSNTGYVLSFDLAIASETSNSANRAGFNVVVVSNDGSTAIELGFDSTGIFAQSADFRASESFTASTFSMSDTVSYDLYVSNTGYRLFANNTEILTGNTRVYNFDPAQSDPPLPVNPYTTQNFVFLGDNTDAASSTFTLNNVSLFT
ncbi:MAG: hypothetical protein AAFR31_06615 [Cyanobacteria bacterium J06627_8]